MLSDLYTRANKHMEKVNFNLRKLKNLLINDKKFVEHGCELENTLQISGSSINTNRGILTQTARFFDPLSFCLPITIRGKTLLRNLWSQKLGRDGIVSEEYQSLWSALSHDLAKLDSLKFPRFVTSEVSPTDFYIFCDAPVESLLPN